jgi:hypothetical protein
MSSLEYLPSAIFSVSIDGGVLGTCAVGKRFRGTEYSHSFTNCLLLVRDVGSSNVSPRLCPSPKYHNKYDSNCDSDSQSVCILNHFSRNSVNFLEVKYDPLLLLGKYLIQVNHIL